MADSSANKEQPTQTDAEWVQIILNQTDYTYEEASLKLRQHNNDYMTVIRSYLKQGMITEHVAAKPLSMNQQIYKEIRSFMDETDIRQVKHSA